MTDGLDATLSGPWQKDFTADNLIEYARASRSISAYIRVLMGDGYNHLVIPSRGAVPFINGASQAWRLETRSHPTFDERLKAVAELNNSPVLQKLVLPFSADPQDDTQTSAAIRKYWTQVLAALVRRDGKDLRLTFYKSLVERLAKRGWLDSLPRDLPTEKFIFVDTVVSGRAICEIFDAFKEAGLSQCHFILLLDADGREMKPEYKRRIDEMVREHRCTLVPVARLFTEDRGPAVSGVWSTAYPQVLDAVRRKFPWAADAYGAGTFYYQVSSSRTAPKEGKTDLEYNMPVTRMHASLSVGVYTAISSLHEMDVVEQELARTIGRKAPSFDELLSERRDALETNLRRQLQYQLFGFKEAVDEMKPLSPLDQQTTRALAEPRVLAEHPNATVDVSSSHLVRVMLPDVEIAAFMRGAEQDQMYGLDVLADDWFR